MKVELTAVLHDPHDRPFRDGTGGPDDPELTLGRAIVNALGVLLPQERELGIDQKFARGALALEISRSSDIELTAEQIATIKKLAGAIYSPVLIARLIPLLDPAAKPPIMT